MDVEIEQPHLAHEHEVHRHATRHWTDYLIPLSALFVSLISILIAWQHGEVMRQLVDQNAKLVRANSLPYLEIGNNNVDPDGTPHVSLMVTNRGVGPAKIETVQIFYDGRPVSSLRQLIEACCGAKSGPILASTLKGRMIQAGQEIRYLDIRPLAQSKQVANRLDEAYRGGRVATNLCYCSLFDECWTVNNSSFVAEPVKQCPPAKVMYNT